jgi:hypothetical protein
VEPLNWTELQARQEQIFDRLRSMGLDKHHRLNAHRKNIAEILDAGKAGRYEEFRDRLTVAGQRERLWSICESVEFVDAVHPLIEKRTFGIQRVLEEALQGPVDLFEETEATNRGRNATFEIVVGGLYARAGFPVEFRENPDILSEYSGRPVVIQCKRPFKSTSVRRNFFDAGKQLRRDLLGHRDGLAIVAMSFSRLFNSGNKIARFSTEGEMETALHLDLRRSADSFTDTLEQIKRYGVSGALFHTGTPAFISTSRQMTFRQLGAMVPVAAKKDERSLLQEIAKLVKI